MFFRLFESELAEKVSDRLQVTNQYLIPNVFSFSFSVVESEPPVAGFFLLEPYLEQKFPNFDFLTL